MYTRPVGVFVQLDFFLQSKMTGVMLDCDTSQRD